LRLLQEIIPHLTKHSQTDHYIVFYQDTESPGAGQFPYDCVRNPELVDCYLQGLEALYAAMTGPELAREPPSVGERGRTVVYVFASRPVASTGLDGSPYLILPCGSTEPTIKAELQRAASEAVHEATHAFNYLGVDLDYRLHTKLWEWFDEGTATYMEMRLLPGNTDHFRFMRGWMDAPHVPLDSRAAKYRAAMFVRYLAARMGDSFIAQVWKQARETESALKALATLSAQHGQVLCSPDPSIADLFATGYCMDAYFCHDPNSSACNSALYRRYGGRTITARATLRPAERSIWEGSIDHLACRYYQFRLAADASQLTVQLHSNRNSGPPALKAEVALVAPDKRRCGVVALRRQPGSVEAPLCATLTEQQLAALDHVVLVVSNCGLAVPHGESPPAQCFDGQAYTIEAQAE
jgi:hypothetical protein